MNDVRMESKAAIPNLINICVDRSVQGEIGGRIYHYYRREPWKFENVVQLLRYMEEFYDGIRFPEAAVMLRNFSETEKEDREKTWQILSTKEEVLNHQGKCATFYTYVQYRQNATWQGRLVWKEAEKEVEFRSALELIILVDNALNEDRK